MPEFDLTGHLGEMVLAAGALGTAAFGIVEALKWTPLGEAGFDNIPKLLGAAVVNTLAKAYGPDYERLLRAQYRKDGGTADLARTLRQGARIGLSADNAVEIAVHLGTVDGARLAEAAAAIAQGKDLTDNQRNAIGRFELAVDARIESGLALARDSYLGAVRATASAVAIGMGALAAFLLGKSLLLGFIVGVAAVPLAPIANDVVGALQAATRALRRSA